MDIQTAKQIKIADYLHSLGFSPVKQQGINLWYKSPLREETEASFKVNTERNQWYDFALGRGGNIIALAQELYCSDHVPYLLQKIEEQGYGAEEGGLRNSGVSDQVFTAWFGKEKFGDRKSVV